MLIQLTPEQIRTMSVAEKDRWWLKNVYQGDVPQFTLKAALCGFLLGGFLSITNLYVGAKTGWTLGVGITAIVLSFALIQALRKLGIVKSFNVLETNIVQSIAVAAGYMTAPLVSSLAAYMMVTGKIIPPWQVGMWLFGLAVLGVLFAFPMKRRFINDEQHPFPEGRAAGVVMDLLHSTGKEAEGKAQLMTRLLLGSGAIAALMRLMQSSGVMETLRVKFLAIPEMLDEWMYILSAKLGFVPNINGVPLKELTIRPELDIAMIGAGGFMGIQTAASLMIGAFVNYVLVVPFIIAHGDIAPVVKDGMVHYGFRVITTWALWGGVATMTSASLFSFFSKPGMLADTFRGLLSRKDRKKEADCLAHIELPIKLSLVGIPVVGAMVVVMAHSFFGVGYFLGALAIPMVFFFSLIAVHSTALTSITPSGALGKLTQLFYGGVAPGNVTTNLMTAGITAEVASHNANLCMNIKPGYMLGGKPRLQAIGHCLGAIAGTITSVFVFYSLFLRGDPANLVTDDRPMPAALIWKGVAEVLTQGISKLSTTAVLAAMIGIVLGIVLGTMNVKTKGRFWLSGVGIGLACVIPFSTCLAMSIGSFIFWFAGWKYPDKDHPVNKIVVQGQETIAGGIVAGAALMGIAITAIELFVLK